MNNINLNLFLLKGIAEGRLCSSYYLILLNNSLNLLNNILFV